jgi:carnitine 3-dehydrogenase
MTITAAIVGGGVIGGGWAARLSMNGHDVRIFDPDPQAQRKIGEVVDNAQRSLPSLSEVDFPTAGTVTFCGSIADVVDGAMLIVEAVPERLDIKQSVYGEIEAANTDGIIASSTSGIMPTDLQAKLTNPGRLIVAHPFNPVYLLPLVEIVGGKKTDQAAIDWAMTFYAELGMKPLHCRVEIEGFLSDRLQEALWREALWLLKDGVATAEELDTAIAYGPGLRWAQMGTMQTFHLAGGEGGMRAMLAMFGPCLKWPWTKLMDVPDLTDEFVEMVGDQCDQQSDPNTPRDLEKIRDNNLVAMMRALKGQNWGAGALLNAHDKRLGHVAHDLDATAPIVTISRAVPLDWTDYNGHMTESRYLHTFADATDKLMEMVGADADYIATGGSFFTAETHIRHLGEMHAGDTYKIDTQVLMAQGKKMHIVHSLIRGDGELAATGEHILIHVDLETRKPAVFGPGLAEGLARAAKAHAELPEPEGVGRYVGQPR